MSLVRSVISRRCALRSRHASRGARSECGAERPGHEYPRACDTSPISPLPPSSRYVALAKVVSGQASRSAGCSASRPVIVDQKVGRDSQAFRARASLRGHGGDTQAAHCAAQCAPPVASSPLRKPPRGGCLRGWIALVCRGGRSEYNQICPFSPKRRNITFAVTAQQGGEYRRKFGESRRR